MSDCNRILGVKGVRVKRLLNIVLVMSLVLLLGACGQSGPLILTQKQQAKANPDIQNQLHKNMHFVNE